MIVNVYGKYTLNSNSFLLQYHERIEHVCLYVQQRYILCIDFTGDSSEFHQMEYFLKCINVHFKKVEKKIET